jgi:hypothetical protein
MNILMTKMLLHVIIEVQGTLNLQIGSELQTFFTSVWNRPYRLNQLLSNTFETVHTQCSQDCGPRKHTRSRTCIPVFTPAQEKPKQFFKDMFFSTGEESSQPTKHENKIIIFIFLIMKATIAHNPWHTRLHVCNVIQLHMWSVYWNRKLFDI